MCAVSMIMDHFHEKWENKRGRTFPDQISPPQISDDEVREFRELLDRAREYDKKHNQPDCELDDKRQALLNLAEQLGVAIDFL